MKTIVHIAFNDLAHESRALKATRVALRDGYADRVVWIGYDGPGLPSHEHHAEGMEIVRLARRRFPGVPGSIERVLQLRDWGRRMRKEVLGIGPNLLHVHSLASLTQAAALKTVHGLPILFDAHELETERHGWSKLRRTAAKWSEWKVIGVPDAMMVVTDSIADWYRDAYDMARPTVVRNLPERPETRPERNDALRSNLGIPADDLIFLYIGVINGGRGYREIVEAFEGLHKDRHAVFLGFGPAVPEIQAAKERLGNVHWHPAVRPHEVPRYAAGADVGLLTIETTALSYKFSFGNKFMQCRVAGIPVISTDLVEHRRYLDRHGGGWILPELDSTGLRDMIAGLTREDIAAKRAEIIDEGEFWDSEEARFIGLMDQVFPKASIGLTGAS